MKGSWSAIALLLCLCAAATAGTETNVLPDPSFDSWPDTSAGDGTDHFVTTFDRNPRESFSSPPVEVKQEETSVAIPLPPALYTGLATLSLLGGFMLRRRIRRQ